MALPESRKVPNSPSLFNLQHRPSESPALLNGSKRIPQSLGLGNVQQCRARRFGRARANVAVDDAKGGIQTRKQRVAPGVWHFAHALLRCVVGRCLQDLLLRRLGSPTHWTRLRSDHPSLPLTRCTCLLRTVCNVFPLPAAQRFAGSSIVICWSMLRCACCAI